MITSKVIIDRIKETSGYKNVSLLQEFETDLWTKSDLPAIAVGYKGLKSQNQDGNFANGSYRTYNENLLQFFVIQIIAPAEIYLSDVWPNVFGFNSITLEPKLIGWNPAAIEEHTTAFNFISEEVIGLSQGLQKTEILIALGFPTFNF
jgi:hypothetical protein